MKSYRELAEKVFERRDKYLAARKQKKKKIIKRVSASVVVLAIVLSISAYHLDWVEPMYVAPTTKIYTQTNPQYDASGDEYTIIEIPPPTTTTTAPPTTTISSEGFPDESLWDKKVDNWYTSENGGVQINVPGWVVTEMFCSSYLLPGRRYEIKSGWFIGADWTYQNIRISCESAGVDEDALGFDPYRTFTQAEKDWFDTAPRWDITGYYDKFDYFEKTTVTSMDKTYRGYKYSRDGKYYWQFQTDYYIYKICFDPTDNPREFAPHDDMKEVGEKIMSDIRIYY